MPMRLVSWVYRVCLEVSDSCRCHGICWAGEFSELYRVVFKTGVR